MSEPPRNLPILSCSQRKRPDPGLLPAIDRYDGVHFRVLKKARRDGCWPSGLRVLILSAEYGLIEADEPIADYDRTMTPDRAVELRDRVGARLDEILARFPWERIFVDVGQTYRSALATSACLSNHGIEIVSATGGIGERARQLKQWLRSTGSTASAGTR